MKLTQRQHSGFTLLLLPLFCMSVGGAEFKSDGGFAFSGSVAFSNQVVAVSYTVAALPVTPSAGTVAYCTDCLTPSGTGSLVVGDGALWRVAGTRLRATTDIRTYLEDHLVEPVARSGVAQTYVDWQTSAYDLMWLATSVTGTGASANLSTGSTDGPRRMVYTGTGTSTYAGYYGPNLYLPATSPSRNALMYARCYLSALPPIATDQIGARVGFGNAANAGALGNDTACFIYDPQTNWTATTGITATNNTWYAVIRTNSVVAAAVNTTAVPSITVTTPDRMEIYEPSGTTGVTMVLWQGASMVYSNTFTLPGAFATSWQSPWFSIAKFTGTTAYYFYESDARVEVRTAARTIP